MEIVKTLETGETFTIKGGYQDTDIAPNFQLKYKVEDASGREIGPKDWDKTVVAEYDRIHEAFKEAGFREAQAETQRFVYREDLNTALAIEEGMQHSRLRTAIGLNNAADHIFEALGYDDIIKSAVMKRPSFTDRVGKPNPKDTAAAAGVDMKALRSAIEEKVTVAMGNTADAMKLSAELGDLVQGHVRGKGRGKADD